MLNKYFQALSRSLPGAFFLLSPLGEIEAVSPGAEGMLGVSTGSIIGKRLVDLVTDPAEKVSRYLQVCLRNSAPMPGSLQWFMPDQLPVKFRCFGHVVVFDLPDHRPLILLRCEPREGTGNKFIAVNKELENSRAAYHHLMAQSERLIREINERKQAEQKLRESEARLRESEHYFRTLANGGAALIWTSGPDKLCNYFNEPWLRYTGRSIEQELGNGWVEGVHPDDFERCLNIYLSNFDRREPFSMEYRLRKANGDYGWILDQGAPRTDSAGNFIGYIGHCYDITERKTVEEELRQTKAQTERLLEEATEREFFLHQSQQVGQIGGWRADPMNNTVMWTEGVYELVEMPLDYKPDLKMALDFYLPDSRVQVTENLRRTRETGVPFCIQVQMRGAKSGITKWTELRGLPHLDSEGRVDYLMGTIQDISSRKEQELALRASEEKFRALVETTGDWIWEVDRHGVYVYASPQVQNILGYAPEEILGKSPFDLMPDEEAKRVAGIFQEIFAHKKYFSDLENTNRHKDGHLVTLETSGVPIFDMAGNFYGYRGTDRDITKRKRLNAELRESLAFNSLLIQAMIDGIAVCHSIGEPPFIRFSVWNKAMEQLTGYSLEEINRLGWYQTMYTDPEVQDKAKARMERMYRGDNLDHEEWIITRKDGKQCIVEMTTLALNYPENHAHVMAVMRDITEHKKALEKLRLAANVFTHAKEGILITDSKTNIVEINQAFTVITGYTRVEVLGKNPRILSSGRQDKTFYTAVWHDLLTTGYWSGEVWNRRQDGTVYAELLTISAVRDEQGDILNYIGLFSDITPLKEHQAQLEHIAHFDALTGLSNRLLLADRLSQAMRQTIRRGQHLAVVYLDLDGFKAVNDTHGHPVGDQLLIAVSKRMSAALRDGDTLARIGGDEFIAVLVDLPDAESSTPILNRLLEAAAKPVKVGDLVQQVSASVGVSFYPQAEEVDADQLVRQADQAMYQAKQSGKNRYHLFDTDHDRNVRGRHESLEQIRQALTNNEFILYYQPKVNMQSGETLGAEALIRWRHHERGLLLPSVFLPLIENHPLAIELGEWVIDTALSQIETWHAEGLSIPVSVNVGALQLQHPDFVPHLRTLLARHPGVQPGELELEVLETSALEDFAAVSRVMHACQHMGIGFAVDDFGTGYSSLAYLKQFPAAVLKIDQGFVRDILDDPNDLAILEGVRSLAIAFRRQVIAEGVETLDHGELLLRMGCALAQGYAIASPMSAEELPRWLAGWKTPPAWRAIQPISRDRLPLLFAAVDHRAWINAMVAFLSGTRDVGPEQDDQQCHFGIWLNDGGRDMLLVGNADHPVDTLHRELHRLAAELVALKQAHRAEEAKARIPELLDLRDQLLAQLSIVY